MIKKLGVLLLSIILILTGCSKITDNYDEITANIMSSNVKVNTASTGYELYIPSGVIQLEDNKYNQKFKIKNRFVYLYVDTISYYYKNMLNYEEENNYSYYYKKLDVGNKNGYIGINYEDGIYYCKIVYNYSKIEFYADKEELPIILANSLLIQKSIKFNDSLIKMSIDNKINDGRDIKYELDKPVDSLSTFSQYLQEYVDDEETKVELPEID